MELVCLSFVLKYDSYYIKYNARQHLLCTLSSGHCHRWAQSIQSAASWSWGCSDSLTVVVQVLVRKKDKEGGGGPGERC